MTPTHGFERGPAHEDSQESWRSERSANPFDSRYRSTQKTRNLSVWSENEEEPSDARDLLTILKFGKRSLACGVSRWGERSELTLLETL